MLICMGEAYDDGVKTNLRELVKFAFSFSQIIGFFHIFSENIQGVGRGRRVSYIKDFMKNRNFHNGSRSTISSCFPMGVVLPLNKRNLSEINVLWSLSTPHSVLR